MFQQILVPLDGSERAEKAIPTAARIARATGATITLLNAITPSPEYGTALVPATFGEADYELMRRESAEYLIRAANQPALDGIQVRKDVVFGPAALAILDSIATHHIDLVVMTSHGRTGFTRWVLGSVAQHIARSAVVPVLILKEQTPILTGQHPDTEHLFRVLVSLDGSALAETAIEPAVALVSALAAPAPAALHLALVISPYEANEENVPSSFAVEGAREYLAKIAHRLQQTYPGMTITYSVGVGLDIAGTLIRIAESGEDVEGTGAFGGCDIVAMATHGRTGLARWIIGSVTDRVLQGTRLPMLIIRPPAMRNHKVTSEEESKDSEPAVWSALF